MKNDPQIALRFNLSEKDIMALGIGGALDGIRLEPGGKVIVPVRMNGGYEIGNPAPCGTWERVE